MRKLKKTVFDLPLRSGLCCLVLVLRGFSGQAQVIINEIMYHPSPAVPEDTTREWLELYNKGTAAVRLDGWRFSHGVSFTFTNATINPGGYLVVAANETGFRNAYPGVTNVVAGWSGKLANDGEKIELVDAAGHTVDAVSYSNEGDWALRRPGSGYPGQPGWWAGWDWQSAADGSGSSLELVDHGVTVSSGQNWAASTLAGGTPGRPNSVATNGTAPLILEVMHAPAVPASTDTVYVTARVISQSPPTTAEVLHRADVPGAEFVAVPMLDDGLHGDGLAGDGVFGAALPATADKTVVEFYVRARDGTGKSRTWPAPTDPAGTQGANALYQVDDFAYTGSQPLYRFIVKASEWSTWLNLMDSTAGGQFSDAQMNATVVALDGSGTSVRYVASLRNRGAGTRSAHPHNLHLSIARDRPLRGTTRLNFNTRFVHSQTAGNAFFAAANLLNADGAPVQVRVNGANLANALPSGSNNSYQFGSYYRFEGYDGDWAAFHIPEDPGGNIYKAVSYLDGVRLTQAADLSYLGPDPAPYKTAYSPNGPTSSAGPYSKGSNSSEDDWSDLINLTYALSPNATDYLAQVSATVDVDEWLRYIAVSSLVLTMETTLATGTGDDYSLYRGISDPRFRILNHDMDTVLGQGDTSPSWTRSIWKAADLPVVSRFLKHEQIAPRYLATLKELCDTVFAQDRAERLLDQKLKGWVPDSYIQVMKDAVYRRRTNVLSQLPLSFDVFSTLPTSNGYWRATTSPVSLLGMADATRTYTVLVNGGPAEYTAWQGTWSHSNVVLYPGVNRVAVAFLDAHGAQIERREVEIWLDTGATKPITGPIAADTLLRAADGPFQVNGTLSVQPGATLRIEPGTTVYLSGGAEIRVDNGGRLLAEGNENAWVHFMRPPGVTTSWAGLVIAGGGNSPESRIAFAVFDGNASTCVQVDGGAVVLDHCVFASASEAYLGLNAASFLIEGCVFPSAAAPFDLVQGSGGIRPGGRGVVRGCYFGASLGTNDVFVFAGGKRQAGGPILEFVQNACSAAGDDILELRGADAWIEGNVFANAHHTSGSGVTAAVSATSDSGVPSAPTLMRNVFFDCDNTVNVSGGSFATLYHNTIVGITNGLSADTSVIDCSASTDAGAGAYFEDNIVLGANALAHNYDPAKNNVTFRNNLLPLAWTGPGVGNRTNAPALHLVPTTYAFSSWDEAQALWEWLKPMPGSPAIGSGANGTDLGANVPEGVAISGEPPATTPLNYATLSIGTGRSSDGIPPTGYPLGSGYTHYRWSLDGSAWSEETPIASALLLPNLANGTHEVQVVGRRDSGSYQDSPGFDYGNPVTFSRSWTVDTNVSGLRLNEILAHNVSTLVTNGETPDLIELHNAGNRPVTLAGKGLTDDPDVRYKFTFPAGLVLQPGAYLVVVADTGPANSLFTGFGLGQTGDSLYLYDSVGNGGALLDKVEFGLQLADLSIGRAEDGTWVLCQPTLGSPNVAIATGDTGALRLNEWLAIPGPASPQSFIELYNPGLAPVSLGGLFLTDAPDGAPHRHRIAELSFIAAHGHAVFIADGQSGNGANHLNFQIDGDGGALGLFADGLIDSVLLGPQWLGHSEGRAPSGASAIASFTTPTPGSGNPPAPDTGVSTTVIAYNLLTLTNQWRFSADGAEPPGPWKTAGYADSGWQVGTGLFGRETSTPYPYPQPITTALPLDTPAGDSIITYYFRTAVVVPTNLTGFTFETAAYVDDGAIFYVNGARVADLRVATDPAAYDTLARNQSNEGLAESIDWGSALLLPGTNLLAVEVHQSGTSSSDIVFGLQLTAKRTITQTNYSRVVINEVLAHPSLPGQADFVELYNPLATVVDLSGFSLTDDPAVARRWVLPAGVILGPGQYLLITCDAESPASTTAGGPLNTGFGLSSAGDGVYLFDADEALFDSIVFGAQAAGLSVGLPPALGGPARLLLPTPNALNIAAGTSSPGPLRINEWAASVAGGPDWFEIYNPQPQPVALGGLFLTDRLTAPNKHEIPPLTFIGTGTNGFLRFVADNNPAQGPLHVGFSLDAGGESIGLFMTGTTSPIDSVTFGAQTDGITEGRFPDGAESREFFNTPTPAAPNISNNPNPGDSDGDGIPDSWERLYGLNVGQNDAGLDPDHDGATNLQEYLAGTNPTDPSSRLAIQYVSPTATGLELAFPAQPGRTYSVLYKDRLEEPVWTKLSDVPVQTSPTLIVVPDTLPSTSTNRFYRVVTPAQY